MKISKVVESVSRREFVKFVLRNGFILSTFKPLMLLAASSASKKTQRWMLASQRIHPMTKLTQVTDEKNCKSTSSIFTTTPDYSVSKFKLAFSNWSTLSGGEKQPEVDSSDPIKIKGVILVDGVVFCKLTFQGNSEVTLMPGTDVWCDEVKVPSWVKRKIEIRTLCQTKLGATRPASYRMGDGDDFVVFSADDTLHNDLMNGSKVIVDSIKATGYFYGPSLMISDGWDGRHVILCVGDSIGYGDNFGCSWITDALDDQQGLRLPYANFCVQGTRPSGQSSLAEGSYRRKAALLNSVNEGDSSLLPFTCVLSEMGVNDAWGSDGEKLLMYMKKWWSFIKSQWPNALLIQTTFTPRCNKDKVNFYTSLESQKLVTTTPPEADRWYVSDVIKTKPSPLDGFIDLREAWTGSSTGYLWRELQPSASLVKNVVAGDKVCVVDKALPVGGWVVFAPGTSESEAELPSAAITQVEGNGPYQITLSSPVSKPHNSGVMVKVTMTSDGIHPAGEYARQFASKVVLAYKVKQLSNNIN